ncbi:MAG: GNAT family N-acetyltransferase [Dehalococcoidia bacterium]|nr:GNAT family N-acetyltransferase [Dehalococcoidia bacterium]
MTDTMPRRTGSEQPSQGAYRVWEERNRRALESVMAEDRALAAYALGHLEHGLYERTRFWLASGPAGGGLVMHANAIGHATVTLGALEAVDAVLALHPGARAAYLSTASPGHLGALRRAYVVADPLHMLRMSLTRDRFTPVPSQMTRLRGTEVHRINALYATEGGPSHYSRDAIDRSVYFGAFEGPRLVSVAGTHVVAPNLGIAVVGNVFTDRAFRGLGLATRVTSAVTDELFALGCAEVTLTVDPANTPAVAAYERLGYEPGARVVEARLRRRDLLGLAPAWRRRVAGRRGRAEGPGIEVIEGRHAPPRRDA